MPINQNVSIIVLGDPGPIDHPVWRTIYQLSDNDWQTEVLTVGKLTPTERSRNDSFPQLGEALTAASHQLIAIVDAKSEVDAAQWKFMAERSQRSPIQTSFCLPRSPKSYLRALLWMYSLVVRLLLGTGKTELHKGVTLFTRKELEPLLSDFDRCEASGLTASGAFAVTQLLALARLNGHRIAETNLDESSPGNGEHPSLLNIGRAFGNALKFCWNQLMYPRRESELPNREPNAATIIAGNAILLVVAGFMLFQNLEFPLFEPDEARNAQLALNILETGEWMSLTLAEDYYWDKPPLQIWAVAACYKLFGVSKFATRFPVAVAAMLTVLMTLLAGRRLIGFQAAWLGTFLLLLTSGFVLTGRYLTMDSSLTAMVTAMLLFGFLAIRNRFSKRHAVMAGVACGVGILIKGPVIAVLCFPPLLAAIWLSPQKQKHPIRNCLWFALPAFLIAAPWFIATAIIHPDFLTYFFWKHHVVRFSSAFNHREPFWYYFVGIFLFMFPASYLIPAVAKFLTSRKPENRLLRTRENGFLFLSAIWIIGFFSISESKLPTYIVPSFPLICLLMGVLLDRKVFNRCDVSIGTMNPQTNQSARPTLLDRRAFHAPLSIAFWTVIIGLIIHFFLRDEFPSITMLVTGMAFIAVVTTIGFLKRSSPKIAWTCYGLTGLLTVSLVSHTLIPSISSFRSIHFTARTIQSSREFKNAPIVFFGREAYGSELSLNQDNVFRFEESETVSMIEFLIDRPSAIIVSSKDPMKALRRDLPWTILIEKCNKARHLYVSRPNRAVIAMQPDTPPLQ